MNSSVSSASSFGLRVAGPHLCPGRQDRLDLRDELLRRDARLGGDADLVELALLVEEPLRGREIEPGQRRAADRARPSRT